MPLRHTIELEIDDQKQVRFTGGVEALFVDMLSKGLKFKYQLFVPPDRQWGRLSESGNWTGMIGMVQHNVTDLAIGDLTITESRSKVVDFVPYAIEETTFATRLPKQIIRHTFYLDPFRWEVWLTWLVLVAILPFVFQKLMKKRVSVCRLMFTMIGNLFHQPISFSIVAARDRFVLGIWILFSLLLSSSYTALLLSSLTVPTHENGIRTLRALSAAVAGGRYKCMTNLGSANVEFLAESPSRHLRVLGKNIIQMKWFSKSRNEVAAPAEIEEFEAILGPKWFFLLEYGEAPFTNKYLFKEFVAVWNIGIAVNKGFCCKKALETYITRMVNIGIFEKLYNDKLFETRIKFMTNGPPKMKSQKVLSLEELFGAFKLWGAGCILASFIQFVIIVIQCFKRRVKRYKRTFLLHTVVAFTLHYASR
ncbi:hypothetical protein JTE90_022156 [Oedothorax gibbosus]|uniref:Ionotropic glutamate receptor L-glutamate and glycine-binding domain-containing protein n=1 Tax=Oedothorax gibbosus TaxID=931172 RepID=A0AAV6VS50_9ARAC|nr:hypothetical protein JTE90_022156 [Oedothorax gibbosus]